MSPTPLVTPLVALNNFALEFAEKRHVSADGTRSGTLKTIDKAIAEATPVCFDQDTLVQTQYGYSEIKYIEPGRMVLARNEATGEQGYRRVTRVFEHETTGERPMYLVSYAQDEGYDEGVYVTAEHPFWVNGTGWVEAANLKPGQELEICDPDGHGDGDRRMGTRQELALSGRRWTAKVLSVKKRTTLLPVYNLEVEDFHTYFVGVFGVWVHNTKVARGPIDATLQKSAPDNQMGQARIDLEWPARSRILARRWLTARAERGRGEQIEHGRRGLR
jgi:hypothetical protein